MKVLCADRPGLKLDGDCRRSERNEAEGNIRWEEREEKFFFLMVLVYLRKIDFYSFYSVKLVGWEVGSG